jgi:uncharacterized protein YndB with AHSA1/START domain
MAAGTFVYVTYIRTTVEKLWEALTEPQFTRRYWSGIHQESDWRPGSSWTLKSSNGDVWDSGQVLEIERPHRLVVSWRNEAFEWAHAIGFTRCTFELAPQGETVKLTITHEVPAAGTRFKDAISQGWPHILSSLKSMLETGQPLPSMPLPKPERRPA